MTRGHHHGTPTLSKSGVPPKTHSDPLKCYICGTMAPYVTWAPPIESDTKVPPLSYCFRHLPYKHRLSLEETS